MDVTIIQAAANCNLAARPELSRKQVAEFDASARAWLRAADKAHGKEAKTADSYC